MGATTPPRVGTVAAAIALVALALLLPGLGTHGLWSDAELPVLDRALAALGEAKSGLVRSPALPDALRTRGVAAFGDELGVRLPHALATAGLVAAAAALARLRGATVGWSALAGLVTLAMPAIGLAGRTALGNPIGELAGVLVVLAAAAAGLEPRRGRAIAIGLTGAAAWIAAIASHGLVLGGCVPLVGALLVVDGRERGRLVRAGLLAALVIAAALAFVLVLRQTDGYIPLLGAAKDLELVDKPELRRFTAALADLGHQSFPWLPIAIVGAALGRDRGVASWLVGGLLFATAWSIVYGRVDLPLRVPVALCAVQAIATIADPERPLSLRRGAAFIAVLGVLVLGKDIDLAPADIAAPLHIFGVNDYPAEELLTVKRWSAIAKLVVLAILLGSFAAPMPDASRRERLIGLVPGPLRIAAMPAFVGVVALWAAWMQTRVLVPATSEKLSPKAVLVHHAALVSAGELGPALAVHRIRDEGVALYGPTELESLASRRDISSYLTAEEPRAVLLRSLDLAAVHQAHRQSGTPMYVLDAVHDHLRLVTNVLPPNEVDVNPIPGVLFDEAPQLEHETLLRFEEYVEVIGWQVDGPIVRGRHHTLQVALRVLRPLPGGSKIYTRFVGGRLSRINGDPTPIADDVYPCNLWRAGDYILHTLEFDAPTLEILPGTYDFMVGLRRSEQKNYTISVPAGEAGEYGVTVDDPKRSFAKLGTVEVW